MGKLKEILSYIFFASLTIGILWLMVLLVVFTHQWWIIPFELAFVSGASYWMVKRLEK